jgi:hypothetical protein
MKLALVAAALAVILVAGCTGTTNTVVADCVGGYHNPPGDRSRCVPDPSRYGTITGRYYADGGPYPPQPPHAIAGTITATSAGPRKTYPAREDADGRFTLAVPVGTYTVVARSPSFGLSDDQDGDGHPGQHGRR